MANRLGGSMFIHNAVEFDYCVKESLESLCALCDDVVVVDAESTDGSLDLLHDVAREQKNLRVISGEKWECGEKYERLAILANIAKSHLTTPWHFMLQADEVIHEDAFCCIRELVEKARHHTYTVRRFNLWGDLNHCLKIDMPQHRKPCNDAPIRLGLLAARAMGDAESIEGLGSCCHNFTDDLPIIHYGMVRRDSNFLKKGISMQSWFFGPDGQPDARLVDMAATHGTFDWARIIEKEFLMKLPITHAKFAQQWAAERQAEKTPVVLD